MSGFSIYAGSISLSSLAFHFSESDANFLLKLSLLEIIEIQ